MSDKQTETPAYVSTAQAAHLTSLSRAWFERSRWSGGGPPFVKLGAAVRYPLDELHAWMRARLRTSSTDDPVSIERPTTEKFSPQLSTPRGPRKKREQVTVPSQTMAEGTHRAHGSVKGRDPTC